MANAGWRRAVLCAAVLGIVALMGLPARAGDLKTVTFAFTGNGSPVFIPAFDPALGTLDRVEVMIIGVFSGSVVTSPNPAGLGAPLPYGFDLQLTQSFLSITPHRGFDTVFSAPYLDLGLTATGLGDTEPFVLPFTDRFTMTAASDLAGGFTVTEDGSLLHGMRDGFLPSPIPGLPNQEPRSAAG